MKRDETKTIRDNESGVTENEKETAAHRKSGGGEGRRAMHEREPIIEAEQKLSRRICYIVARQSKL